LAQGADQVQGDRGDPGRGDGGDVHLDHAVLPAGVQLVVLARLQPPFAGQVRIAFAHVVERARDQDRHQAAQHDRRQHLGEQLALRLMHELHVADRERDGPFAHPARHDRHHDEEEGVEDPEAEQRPDAGADDGRDDGSERQGQEDLEEALDQHGAVHPEDAADDDRRDEQIEEVAEVGELGDRVKDLLGQQMVKREERGDEGREDRGRPDVPRDGEPLAELGAGEAAHR
jgi:hypothetical protein